MTYALAEEPADQADDSILNIQNLLLAPVATEPFEYMVVTDFIQPQWLEPLIDAYPELKKGGSFPLWSVSYGSDFAALIDAMNGDEFRHAIETKFSVDLENRPTMFTVRGQCRSKDGKIHTDTESKIITVLLYMNRDWPHPGGRLRILRSGEDIDDVAAEVAPLAGTLVVFKRSDHSFHAHLPYDGSRNVIQMNWVTHQDFVDREARRHGWSAFLKRLRPGRLFGTDRKIGSEL